MESYESYISYSVMIGGVVQTALDNGGQPGGFFGPWGGLFRNMSWELDPNGFTILNGTIPGYSEYFVSLPETYIIHISSDAILNGCEGFVLATFTVIPDSGSGLINVLPTISTSVATGAVALTLISGGSGAGIDAQALAVFSLMSCASSVEAKQSGPLRYFLSPFADVGLFAMLGGNFGIIAFFSGLQMLLAKNLRMKRRIDVFSSFAAVRFPKYSFIIASFLQQGIAFSSFVMIARSVRHGVDPLEIAIGTLGSLYVVAFPIAVRQGISVFARVTFVKYWQFKKKSPFVRWLYPLGYWQPLPQRQVFGSMFCNMKGKYIFWGTFQMNVLVIVTAISAVTPPRDMCHVQYLCMAGVLFAAALIAGVLDPMRSPLQTVLAVCSLSCLGTIMVVNAVNVIQPSSTTSSAITYLSLVQVFIMLVTLSYNTIIFYAESKIWSTMNAPRRDDLEDVLDIDLEGGAQEDDLTKILRQLMNEDEDENENGSITVGDDDNDKKMDLLLQGDSFDDASKMHEMKDMGKKYVPPMLQDDDDLFVIPDSSSATNSTDREGQPRGNPEEFLVDPAEAAREAMLLGNKEDIFTTKQAEEASAILAIPVGNLESSSEEDDDDEASTARSRSGSSSSSSRSLRSSSSSSSRASHITLSSAESSSSASSDSLDSLFAMRMARPPKAAPTAAAAPTRTMTQEDYDFL